MALRWVEPFDQYSSGSELASKRQYSHTSNPIIETTTVKDGRASLSNPISTVTTPNLPGAPFTGRVVAAFWWRYVGNTTAVHSIFGFFSAASPAEVTLRINVADQLEVWRSSTILGTGLTALAQNTWHFIEFRARINNSISANDCIVRVNEVEEINLAAGTNTRNTNAQSERFQMNAANAGNGVTAMYFDSLTIYDDSGTSWNANTFEGQYRMQALAPNGNGATNQFTGSDADSTDNYLHVDEEPHDSDTSYNQSNTVGHIDLYDHANISGSPPSVKAVHLLNINQKTSGGARTFRHVVRSGGTNYFSSGKNPAESSYNHFHETYETDPDTGSAWTVSAVNAAQFGVEVQS